MSGGVTIVKVGGNQSPTNTNIIRTTQTDNAGRNSRYFFNNPIYIKFRIYYKLHFSNNVHFLLEL